MDEQHIKELFLSRSEEGLAALEAQYGLVCRRIAGNILNNAEDAEECVNDAFLTLWNRIPPEDPASLSAYLYKVVRNIAISRYRQNTAKKRNSAYDVALDELAEVLAAPKDVEGEVLANELTEHIEAFLAELPREQRFLFVCRYWYSDTVPELAEKTGLREQTVSVKLFRIRNRLKQYLAEKGVYVHGT